MKKTAVLFGATGLVGSHCLAELLENKNYAKVIVITRRTLGIQSDKLAEIIIELDKLATLQMDETVDDIYCCLGTTIKKAGSQEQFRKVDFNYVLKAAQWGLAHGAQQFLVVSAVGANYQSRIFYNRVKGEMEEAIKELNYSSVYIFRPSMLGGERNEFRLGEWIGTVFLKLIGPLMLGKAKRYKIIAAEAVAGAMIKVASKKQYGRYTIESENIVDYLL